MRPSDLYGVSVGAFRPTQFANRPLDALSLRHVIVLSLYNFAQSRIRTVMRLSA
jgi:hypothetical protein